MQGASFALLNAKYEKRTEEKFENYGFFAQYKGYVTDGAAY